MLVDVHFLRPWWLLLLLPLSGLLWRLWRQNPPMDALRAVCDAHLLPHLVQNKGRGKRHSGLLFLGLACLLMLTALAGPAWQQLPIPSWQAIQPRVLLLDMSENMQVADLTPDRLTRARFKLHDLFQRRGEGQFGLVVFTSEPFIVSPLTEDSRTIDALLQTLTPEIMPVGGERLDNALQQAAQLMTDAGFTTGQILVLTSGTPDASAINKAAALQAQGVRTSVMPVVADQALLPLFQPLATAGHGWLLPFTDGGESLDHWLKETSDKKQMSLSEHHEIPLWRDEGRWFLWPALFFFWPVFWRGWLQRVAS